MSLVLLFNDPEKTTFFGTAVGGSTTQQGAAFARLQVAGTAPSESVQQLRVYGRVGGVNGIGGTWVVVTTDANGDNSNVWLTVLCQALKLSLNEDPFFADYGIPAQQSVVTQVFPDYYAIRTQRQFAPYFASLVITRIQGSIPPVYSVQAVCYSGALLTATVAT